MWYDDDDADDDDVNINKILNDNNTKLLNK